MQMYVRGVAGSTEVKCRSSCSVQGQPPRNVVFFEGDQIDDDDTRDILGRERWSPDCHLTSLCNRFGTEAAVLV